VCDILLNTSALCAVVFFGFYVADMLTPHDRTRHWQSQAIIGFIGLIGAMFPVVRLMGFASTDITVGGVIVSLAATVLIVLSANERLMFAFKSRRSRLTSN